jgi:SAM-dependent methyltransferase
MRTDDSGRKYDYALFEYYRSAKVIAFLERAGVSIHGRVLDAGCGGGGMPLSLAEHADEVIGIDPIDRFGDAGVKLARERGLASCILRGPDGMALPFATGAFDLVLSHAVIEHVADAPLYLRECRRVTQEGRPAVSVHGAVSVVCGRASAPAESARSPSFDLWPDGGLQDVPLAGAARARHAQGTGAREIIHSGCPQRGRQGRRPASNWSRCDDCAARSLTLACGRPRRTAYDEHREEASGARWRLARIEPADAERADQ